MLTGLLLGVLVVLRCFPALPVARWLDRTLVAGLRRVTRTHLIFLLLMSVLLVAGTELLAMAGPFDVGLVVMWDVSVFVDALIATVTVASVARSRAGWRAIALWLPRMLPRRRAPRTPSATRPDRPSANDDERPVLLAA